MALKFPQMPRLKRRPDFLRAAAGNRFHARAFSLQATPLRPNQDSPSQDSPSQEGQVLQAQSMHAVQPARFGITVTKRIGDAVERNRIRRRLKEALRVSPDLPIQPGRDYVIVAKAEALTTDFQVLQSELLNAVRKIDRPTRLRPSKTKPAQRPS